MSDLREMWAIVFNPPPSRGSLCGERKSASLPGQNRWNPNAGALRVSVARTRILTHLCTHTNINIQDYYYRLLMEKHTHIWCIFNRLVFNRSQQACQGRAFLCVFSCKSAFPKKFKSFFGFNSVKYWKDLTRFKGNFRRNILYSELCCMAFSITIHNSKNTLHCIG